MPFPVRLVAFNQVGREVSVANEVVLKDNDVYTLPLEWFEKDLQVQVELSNEKVRCFSPS